MTTDLAPLPAKVVHPLTPGQRFSAHVSKWLEEHDRPVSYIARQAGLNRTTLANQIKKGKWSLDCSLPVARVIGVELEEFAA